MSRQPLPYLGRFHDQRVPPDESTPVGQCRGWCSHSGLGPTARCITRTRVFRRTPYQVAYANNCCDHCGATEKQRSSRWFHSDQFLKEWPHLDERVWLVYPEYSRSLRPGLPLLCVRGTFKLPASGLLMRCALDLLSAGNIYGTLKLGPIFLWPYVHTSVPYVVRDSLRRAEGRTKNKYDWIPYQTFRCSMCPISYEYIQRIVVQSVLLCPLIVTAMIERFCFIDYRVVETWHIE